MGKENLDVVQGKLLEMCKGLGKKVEEFDCGYRQGKNCRIINGKPYCDALANARNKVLKKEVDNILKEITRKRVLVRGGEGK